MRKCRKDLVEQGYRALWVGVSLAVLLGWSAGCSSEDQAETGGYGGDAGRGGASLIADPNVHDDSWASEEAHLDLHHDEAPLVVSPLPATACTSGTQCPTGYCVDGFCCDSKCDNKCMACSAAKKGSGADGICGSIKYDTDPDNDCPYGACDGKNMCKNYNGFSCTAAPQCLSNYCVDGFCCNNICMGSCQACSAAKKGSGQDGICGSIKTATDPDNECSNGDCNGSGACTTSPQPTFPNGTDCTSAAQCASGYCADGVCCDSWCLGTCQACTTAKKNQGSNGTCGPIANDKDPDEECWGGACNGAGVCKQYNGVPCVDKTQCLSNYCVDGFCCGNICTGMCFACSEARKGGGYDGACGPILSGRDPDNECNPGECNGVGTCNQPQTPQVNGTTCVSAGQCASGNCVDGVCCDTTCTGSCQACSATKKGQGVDGTCGNISAETDPDSECGYGSRCGGNGTCRYYNGLPCASASQCFSNYCVDGVCCGNICNQTCHACTAAKKGQGVDGACGPIANTRDPDNECNPGECNGSGACNQTPALLPNGAACTLAAQCASNHCIDGFCCDTTCEDLCEACSALRKGQGTDGTCGPIKYDTDPDGECEGGACSGDGYCQNYNGGACVASPHCLSSYCVDGVCCANQCSGTCQACSAAKKGSGIDGVCGLIPNNTDPDNECALTCNGAGACNTSINGTTCASASECTSGFCMDGVCCNSACTDACRSCAMPGSVGICTDDSSGMCGACLGNVGLPDAPCIPAYMVSGGTMDIVTPDLNEDGTPDIVTANSATASVSVVSSQSPSSFAPAIHFTTGSSPRALTAADVNRDGHTDIVVANYASSTISVLLGQGNGSLAPRIDYATGNYPNSVTAADLNGDGFDDIATSNFNGGTVSVFINRADGTFLPKVDYAAGNAPVTVLATDMNADGARDIAVLSRNDARIGILLNQGAGTFAPRVSYATGLSPRGMAMADFNGDGIMDFATANYYSPISVSVLRGQGNGTLAAKTDFPLGAVPEYVPEYVFARDITGDGKPDVAVVGGAGMQVLTNQGNGQLQSTTRYLSPNNSASVAMADVSGDGFSDFLIACDGVIQVLYRQSNGSYASSLPNGALTYPSGAQTQSLAMADFDNDDRRDLATCSNAGIVSVFRNQGSGSFAAPVDYPTPGAFDVKTADINGDGAFDLVAKTTSTASVRLNQGNGTFGAPTAVDTGDSFAHIIADFTGDGKVDMVGYDYVGSTATTKSMSNIRIVRNNGDGTFATPESINLGGWFGEYLGRCKSPLTYADFDGDGRLDFALLPNGGTSLKVYRNQGNAVFNSGINISVAKAESVAAGDVNSDGKPDLVVGIPGQVNVYLNQGNGTFVLHRGYVVTTTVYNVQLVDMTGDGNADIVLSNSTDNTVVIIKNIGNGLFTTAVAYGTNGVGSSTIVVGDLNGDGRPDVVTGNYDSNNVSVLLQGACH